MSLKRLSSLGYIYQGSTSQPRNLWVSTHDAFCPRRYAPSLSKVYKCLHISATNPVFVQAGLSPCEEDNQDGRFVYNVFINRQFYDSGGVDRTVTSSRWWHRERTVIERQVAGELSRPPIPDSLYPTNPPTCMIPP